MNGFQLSQPKNDGLEVSQVKPWSADKHHFLRRYIHGFTQAMKNKKWAGLHYIDLFAGPGVEEIEGGGLDWGSPLIAAQSKHPFSRLHLVELDQRKHDALAIRLANYQLPNPPQLILGDANQAVNQVVDLIPHRTLSLAFLDPYGLHLHFSTLRKLANKRVDLIIFFPDYLDAIRNWKTYYKGHRDSNLTLVLGTSAWETQIDGSSAEKDAEILAGIYVDQIRSLGYAHFDYKRISRRDGRFLYRLVFCSMDVAGLKIWSGISQKEPDGQGRLF